MTAAAEPIIPAAPAPPRRPWHLWALALLTAISAFLCFNRLTVPPLLIDECFTYWRTCGNLGELLDTLRNDAFTPLHYELLNWIHNGFPLGWGIALIPGGIALTPTVMRFVPALCGTAMTPVMYFLARQLFTRRTALIAAAFITFSAYGLFFSRNAKMYAPAWMLQTLSIACFCWWLRTARRIAWLCWIAAGIAAGGFHSIVLLLLPLMPLYFVSRGKFAGWRVPMLLAGLLLIAAGPAIYYAEFNYWTHNSGGLLPGVVGDPAPDAKWQMSGLNWVEPAENSLRPPLQALNTYLSGYEWSDFTSLSETPPILRRFTAAMVALAVTTYALFILGALPWPHLRRINDKDPIVQPWWRSLLWLALWMVLPVYGLFYCRSVANFSPPTTWIPALLNGAGPIGFIGLPIGIGIAILLNRRPRLAKFLAIPLVLLLVAASADLARGDFKWLVYLAFPVIRVILIALIPALLFHYSGATLRQRALELLRLLAVLCAVFVLCEVAFLLWNHLHDLSMRRHPELPWQSIWHTRYLAIVWPAVWLAAAALIARLPFRAVRIAAVVMICSYNLANALAREYVQTEVPLDRVAADICSARPDTNVRTYFDLRAVLDSSYYRPLIAYNACMAAGLTPTPAEFRSGNTWPFQYGTFVAQFKDRCIYNPTISAAQIHTDTAADPKINRVIIWEVAGTRFPLFHFGDPAVSGLGNHWTVASDETITVHWYWTWTAQWNFRRREFHRAPK